MSEQQEEDKKNYETKERQAALKKSKEMKLADMKVSCELYSECELWYVVWENLPLRNLHL